MPKVELKISDEKGIEERYPAILSGIITEEMYLMRIKDLNRALERMKPTDRYSQFIVSVLMGLIVCAVIVFRGLYIYVVVPILLCTILSSLCLLRYQHTREKRESFIQAFVDDLNNADANRLRWKYKKPRKGRDGSLKGESIEIKILIRIPEPFSLPEHVLRGAQRTEESPEYEPADYTRPPPGDPRLPPGERLLSPLETMEITVDMPDIINDDEVLPEYKP